MIEVKRADEVKAGERICTRRGEAFANVTAVRTVANGTGVEILTDGHRLPWLAIAAPVSIYRAGDPFFA